MALDLGTLAQHGMRPKRTGFGRIGYATWSFIRDYPLGSIGGLIALLLIAMAIAPQLFTTQDPNLQALSLRYNGLSTSHWMGMDQLGRDQYTRLVYGARTSIFIGFGVIAVTSSVGMFIGTVSGYIGGWFDTVMQRVVDVWIALPGLPFQILLVTALTFMRVEFRLALAVGILIAPSTSRIIRGATLQLKQEPYIEAARSIGATTPRVIWRHIVPNVVPIILVSASTLIGAAVLIESGLSFLGYGVQPPTASWGRMLSDAREFMAQSPHLAIFPGLAIFFTVYGFNMLGDAVRDKVDPRLRGSK